MKKVRIVLVDTKTPPEDRARRMAEREHTGHLVFDPSVGRSVVVIDEDNPSGGLMTSMVKEIEHTAYGWEVKTRNSIYQIHVINDPDRILQ